MVQETLRAGSSTGLIEHFKDADSIETSAQDQTRILHRCWESSFVPDNEEVGTMIRIPPLKPAVYTWAHKLIIYNFNLNIISVIPQESYSFIFSLKFAVKELHDSM